MVTIIPKPPQRTPQWQMILFYSSLVLALVAFLSYFVLIYLEHRSSSRLEALERDIAGFGTAEDKKIEAYVFEWQEKIRDFSGLLDQHHQPSRVFKFLEKLTHPQVWFTSFVLIPSSYTAKLEGQARDFQSLAQQIYIFRQENLIESANLTNLGLGDEGEVVFSVDLSISPRMFKFLSATSSDEQ